MLKAYKYRIYPNKVVSEKIQWTLDRCRELYNAALTERRDAYNFHVRQHPNFYDPDTRKRLTQELTISYATQQNALPDIKATLREEYQDIGSHVLQNVCKRIDLAFVAFFHRCSHGETPGYPRFKGRARYDSFTYPDSAGWKLEGKTLHLYKIGDVTVKLHRAIEGKAKTCTIKREGEHWYAVFACEVEQPLVYHPSQSAVGIDLGLLHFATLSTGETIVNPRHLRTGEKKLARLQQALARKKRGSHRRKKAVQRVAKAHRKIRNQRADFQHKESRKLVNAYSLIVFEDLQPVNMSKRAKPKQDKETGAYLPNGAAAKSGLNKSIQDAGWSQFVGYCKSKAEGAGSCVLTIDPRYTSQVCSGCGSIRKKALSERWHSCECGCSLDRDHNAALNILRAGRVQRGATCVEAPVL